MEELVKAADESELRSTAEENTRDFLTALANRLGYEDVEVRFRPAAAP